MAEVNRLTGGAEEFINSIHEIEKKIDSLQTSGTGSIYVEEQLTTADPSTGVETIFGALPDGTYGLQQFVNDVTPPDQPSTPTVVGGTSIFEITWNGLDVNAATPPADYDRTVVEMATAADSGIWSEVNYFKAAGRVVVGEQPVKQDRFFRLVSVDTNGNRSVPSAVVSAQLTPYMESAEMTTYINSVESDIANVDQKAVNAQTDATTAQQAADAAQKAAEAAAAQATNAVTDPSFEGRTDGSNAGGGWVVTTETARTGTKSAKHVGQSGSSTIEAVQNVPVLPGQTWEFSAWTKTTADYNGTSSWGKLRIYKDNNTFVNAITWPNSADWKKTTLRYVVPTDGTVSNLSLQLAADNTTGTIWADDVEAKNVTEYLELKKAAADAQAKADSATEDARLAAEAAGRAQTTADGKNTVWYEPVAPAGTAHVVNDVWFDTDNNNKPYRWNGTTWELRADTTYQGAISTAITDFETDVVEPVRQTVDGKNTVYTQATQPVAPAGGFTLNDVWYDTANKNEPKTWNGTAWVSARDALIGDVDAKVDSTATTLDTRITDEKNALTTKINTDVSTVDTRITNEISTVNTTINDTETSLTSKINTDVQNAISTAASDATTKANAARDAAIASSITDVNAVNKWLYTKRDVGTAGPGSTIPTPAFFDDPVYTRKWVPDATRLMWYDGEYYYGSLRTLLYVNTAKTISFSGKHDDTGSVYLDGVQVYAGSAVATPTISLSLSAGWHTLDLMWGENAGADGWDAVTPQINTLVDKMVAPTPDADRALRLSENTLASAKADATSKANQALTDAKSADVPIQAAADQAKADADQAKADALAAQKAAESAAKNAENLVFDGGFELGEQGKTINFGNSGSAIITDATDARSGTGKLRLLRLNDTVYPGVYFPTNLEYSRKYRLTLWARAGAEATTAVPVYFRTNFKKTDGTTTWQSTSRSIPNDGAWHKQELAIDTDPTRGYDLSKDASVFIQASGTQNDATSLVDVDDVSLIDTTDFLALEQAASVAYTRAEDAEANAIAAAATDATTKANEAERLAKEAAALDASAKAEQAEADAVAVAAADAKAKADQALLDAKAADVAVQDIAEKAQADATAAQLAAQEAAQSVDNQLVNPSFEQDVTGWDGPTLDRIVTSTFRSGTKSYVTNGAGELRQGAIAVEEGQIWSFAMWYKTALNFPTTANGGLRLQSSSDGGTTWSTAKSTNVSPSTDVWAKNETEYVVPVGVTHIRARIAFAYDTTNASAAAWLDDISLKNVTQVRALEKAATDAHQRAVDAEANAIAEAQVKADAAKQAAIDAAALDASAKAEQAEADAVAAAATDATNKANTAKQDAITAAATDATNKANAAEQAAKDAAALDATAKAEQAEADAITAAAADAKTKADKALADAKLADEAVKAIADAAQADADAAAALANSKGKTYFSTTEPAIDLNGLWVDTDNGNLPHRSTGKRALFYSYSSAADLHTNFRNFGWTVDDKTGTTPTLEAAKGYDLVIFDGGVHSVGNTDARSVAQQLFDSGISVITAGNDTTSLPGMFGGYTSPNRTSDEKANNLVRPAGTHPLSLNWADFVENDANYGMTNIVEGATTFAVTLTNAVDVPMALVREYGDQKVRWIHSQSATTKAGVDYKQALADYVGPRWVPVQDVKIQEAANAAAVAHQRAIDAEANAIAEAQVKADAAKQAAIDAAALDATAKAEQAEADAAATAALDATAKADKARQDAIDAAALDATTKSNNAKQAAIDAAALDATQKAEQAEADAAATAALDATAKANKALADAKLADEAVQAIADAAQADADAAQASADAAVAASFDLVLDPTFLTKADNIPNATYKADITDGTAPVSGTIPAPASSWIYLNSFDNEIRARRHTLVPGRVYQIDVDVTPSTKGKPSAWFAAGVRTYRADNSVGHHYATKLDGSNNGIDPAVTGWAHYRGYITLPNDGVDFTPWMRNSGANPGWIASNFHFRDVTDTYNAIKNAATAQKRAEDAEANAKAEAKKLADAAELAAKEAAALDATAKMETAEANAATEAARLANNALLEAAGLAGAKGKVWFQGTAPVAGTTYSWTGTEFRSPAVKKVDGVEVRRNVLNLPYPSALASGTTITNNVSFDGRNDWSRLSSATNTEVRHYADLASMPDGAKFIATFLVHNESDTEYSLNFDIADVSGGSHVIPARKTTRLISNAAARADYTDVYRFFDNGLKGGLNVLVAERNFELESTFDPDQPFFNGNTPDDRENDLWINTAEGNKPYRWDHASKTWVAASDKAIADAQTVADAAKAAAEAAAKQHINAVSDASFEAATAGSALGVKGWVVDGTTARTGTKSAKAPASGTTTNARYYDATGLVPVQPGQVWRVSAWYMTTSDFNGTAHNSKLRLGNQNNGGLYGGTFLPNQASWTNITYDYTVPTDGSVTAIVVGLGADHYVGTLWVDDVSFTEVTNLLALEKTARDTQAAVDAASLAAQEAAQSGDNRIINPSFELKFLGWSGQNYLTTAKSLHGSTSWYSVGTGELYQAPILTSAGRVWRMEMDYITDAGFGTANGGIRLQYTKDNGATWLTASYTNLAEATSWTRNVAPEFTAPIGTTHVRARIAFAYTSGVKLYIDNVMLSDVTDLREVQESAKNATTIANSKNRITNATIDPNEIGTTVGDLWYKRNGSDVVVAQWEWRGGSALSGWVPTTVGNEVIANLDAGKINAGTISAERIGAASIGVEKLTVGDLTNAVVNGRFELGTDGLDGWTPNQSGVVVSDSGTLSGKALEIGGTGGYPARYQNNRIKLKGGDKVRMKGKFKRSPETTSNTPGTFRIMFYGSYGSHNWGTAASNPVNANTWYEFNAVATAPTGTTEARIWVEANTATPSGAKVWFGDLETFRMNGGELIVDGAITTEKLEANAVTATKIAANAITAEKVAAEAITAQKLVVSDFENLWHDPKFNEASPLGGYSSKYTGTEVIPQGLPAVSIRGRDNFSGYAIPVKAGDSFRITYTAKLVAGTAALQGSIWIRTITGGSGSGWNSYSMLGAWIKDLTSTDLGNGWERRTAHVTIPTTWTDVYSASLYMQVGQTSPYTTEWLISDIVWRRMANGELIVDGAIIATKLAAEAVEAGKIKSGAITSDKIDANAVTAAKIAAGTITADKLTIGGAGNLHPDSQFLSPTIWGTTTRMEGLGTGRNGGGSMLLEAGTTQRGQYMQFNSSTAIPVTPGASYRVGAWVNTSVATASSSDVRMYIRAYKSTKIDTTSYQWTSPWIVHPAQVTVAGAWSQLDGIVTIPDGYDRLILGVFAEGVFAGTARFSDVYVQSAIDGTTITDNAISTNKIAANAIISTKIAGNSIEAGHLKSDSITSTKIKAGAITADKLTVGAGGNLHPDPAMLAGETIWQNPSWFESAGTGRSSGNGSLVIPATTTQRGTYMQFNNAALIPVTEGASYRVGGWARTSAATALGNIRIYTRVYKSNDLAAGAGFPNGNFVTAATDFATTTWNKLDGLITIPAGYDRLAVGYYVEAAFTGTTRFSDTFVQSAVDGTTITGNAITTDKIAADAVTATKILAGAVETDKLAANAVTAQKIAAGTITADRLAVGDLTNLWHDPKQNEGWYGDVSKYTGTDVEPNNQPILQMGSTDHIANHSIAAQAGDGFRVRFTAKRIAGTDGINATPWIRNKDGQGGSGWNPWSLLSYQNGYAPKVIADYGNGWARYESAVVIPEAWTDVATARFYIQIPSNGDKLTQWLVADFDWRRTTGLTLIQDGAITTDKIASRTIKAEDIATNTITAESGVIGSIDAGKITVGEMNAARIQAGSIQADRLVVGQGDNLISDPHFTQNSALTNARVAGSTSGAVWTTPDYIGWNRTTALETVHTLRLGGLVENVIKPIVPAIAGRRYKVDWKVFADVITSTSTRAGIRWASRTGVETSALGAWVPLSATGITSYSQEFVAPDDAAFMVLVLEFNRHPGGGWLDLTRPSLQLMTDGTVITKDAVTTDHIQASTITGGDLNVSSVQSAIVTANMFEALPGGTFTGPKWSGGTHDGATFQTSATANRGVKMTPTGIFAYDANGATMVAINANGSATFTGSVTVTGGTVPASTVSGTLGTGNIPALETTKITGLDTKLTAHDSTTGTVNNWKFTGEDTINGGMIKAGTVSAQQVNISAVGRQMIVDGVIQTVETAQRGVKITELGLFGYDTAGNTVFSVATDGTASFTGSVTVTGGSIPAGNVTGTLATGNIPTLEQSKVTGLDTISSNASAAKTRVDAWTTTGTTTINGGQITTDSIKAAQIDAGSVGAELVSAGSIKSTPAADGSYAVMDNAGFRAYSGASGTLVETIKLTGNGNVLVGDMRTAPAGQPGLVMTNNAGLGYNAPGIWFSMDGSKSADQAAIWADADNGNLHLRPRQMPTPAGSLILEGSVWVKDKFRLDAPLNLAQPIDMINGTRDYIKSSSSMTIKTALSLDVETTNYLTFLTGLYVQFRMSDGTVYSRTTSQAANMYMSGTDGRMYRSTSSLKYKKHVSDFEPDPNGVLALRPRKWRDRKQDGVDEDFNYYHGFVAEEVEKIYPELVTYVIDEQTGQRVADGLQYDRFATVLVAKIKEQEARIVELEKAILKK